MYKYATNASYREMKNTLKLAEEDLNNEELKKEVNYRVGTFLHWLLDYYEYIEKTCNRKIGESDSSFLGGLRYANNKLKHDPNVIQVYERSGGLSIPIEFPLCCEAIAFRWGNIEAEENCKFKNQYNNYVKHIKEKEILMISGEAMERLKAYE